MKPILHYIAVGLAIANVVRKVANKKSRLADMYKKTVYSEHDIDWDRLYQAHDIKSYEHYMAIGTLFSIRGPAYFIKPVRLPLVYIRDHNGIDLPYDCYMSSEIDVEFLREGSWGKPLNWTYMSYVGMEQHPERRVWEQYPYTLKPIHDARIVYGKPMGVKRFDRMADELYSFIYGKMIVDGIIPKDCIK